MPSLDEIRRHLAGYSAQRLTGDGRRRAAVAMVLRPAADGPEVLFIERAQRRGDPWSGHMAFPGGRIEPGDPHVRFTAERETREEVGVDLAGAETLGRLDDLQGHRAAGATGLVISAFVYHLPSTPPLVLNHEVREAFWFPLRALREPERRVELPIPQLAGVRYPGVVVGEPDRHVVWGLTYRFLEVFFQAVRKPLPQRWSGLEAAAPTRG
jgi:8-oxo-dGTP pyrophosphatase MutT (NUDIX family)